MEEQHYLALYRKYRPQTFDDVRGRETIVRTLKNQIAANRIGHSYLFCGTRGTGKTTIAKIFAKAVNCENPQDGNPCGECSSCRAIGSDSSLNVVELDAASNNSVDDIRAIINQVSYSPTEGKFRVYIIDEAHMLSTSASNALLKTLEEPPSYAIFILATTEPNRLPITILSRCQRYDYGRLSTATIADRLKEVSEHEGLKAEEKAFHFIASAADGSLRDGLSLLDQCNAFNMGNDILTYEKTLEILGAVDVRVFGQLFRYIHEGQTADALAVLEGILMQGRELVQFVTDYIWYLRNLMLLKASENVKDQLDISADNLQDMIALEREAELPEIMRSIRIFSALTEEIRYSANRRILTEMAIIRACRPAMNAPQGEEQSSDPEKNAEYLQERVRVLERRLLEDERRIADLSSGVVTASPQMADAAAGFAQVPGGAADRAQTSPAAAMRETGGGNASAGIKLGAEALNSLRAAVPEEVEQSIRNWSAVIAQAPDGLMKRALSTVKKSLGNDGELLLVFDNFITANLFTGHEENCEWLEGLLAQSTGARVKVQYKYLDKGEKFTDNYVDLQSLVTMEIVEEDI